MNKRIYADNAATTRLSKKALEEMLPFFREEFGNPSSIYTYGIDAKNALERSRRTIAKCLGAMSTEIFFTSGGTESDNWALHSVCDQYSSKGKHIISTAMEHNAIIKTLEKLESRGFEVTLLTPDKYGQVSCEDLKSAIRPDTILVSIMMANNVVGTILDIKELSEVAHSRGVLFHTDAIQAAGHIPINARDLNIDLLSISAHKFHGPKGVGALYSKVPRLPVPYLTGGGQERGGRSGTENVPGVVGMAAALDECVSGMEEHTVHLTKLRDKLIKEVLSIDKATLTGDPLKRLPGHASFVFENIRHSVFLVNNLNEVGICVSSGSACSASSQEASHVLLALGYSKELAFSTLRITLSVENTFEEVEYIAEKIK
ncbi:MAG: cysteine desulfurase [Deltaproteobacteria bacterium]|jgi:cysteine desulfurase|nr:cysteine desulfurase [Deltaproteobacteria bacterium]